MVKAEFICCNSGGGKDTAIKLSSIPKNEHMEIDCQEAKEHIGVRIRVELKK